MKKKLIIISLNIICFILLRYLNILIIFLIGGYASNLSKDSYWYLLPSFLLQASSIIYVANKTQNKLHYTGLLVISILFIGSYLRLIPEIILPY